MTLLELIYEIGDLALKKNLINAYYAGNTIYYTNGDTVRSYPYLFLSPASDHTVGDQTITYGLVLYYVDRLTEENRNEEDIMSTSINTLVNVGRQIKELPEVQHVYIDRIRNFLEPEKFADACAGAYMYVRVECLLEKVCADYVED